MEEDWSLTATAPSFSLIRDASPEEEAEKDTYVDSIVYNRWTKAQRKLYRRLKTELIAKKIREKETHSLDEISNLMTNLTFLKTDDESDPLIDALINDVEKMKLNANLFKQEVKKTESMEERLQRKLTESR